MTTALIALIGTLGVALIGILATRLDANDQHKRLAQKVDMLGKLDKRDDAYLYERMSVAVALNLDWVMKSEAFRWKKKHFRTLQTAAWISATVMFVLLIVGREFDLGEYEPLRVVAYWFALVATNVFSLLIWIDVFDFNPVQHWKAWRAGKGEEKRETAPSSDSPNEG